MTTTEAALIMSADETGSINQSVSSNEIPNNAVDYKLRFTAITLVAANGSTYLLQPDIVTHREDKVVLRNQRDQALQNEFQQYLLYQEYQTDSDGNDNTDSDDDSSDDSLPPLLHID